MTDEELDALDIMADLQRLVDDEGDVLARASLQYITALRSQLAEVQAERDAAFETAESLSEGLAEANARVARAFLTRVKGGAA